MVTLPTTFLLYAFRYALGRSSYAPADVADALIANADRIDLSPWRGQVIGEIKEAIEQDRAGAPADVDRWRLVAAALAAADELPARAQRSSLP